MSSLVLNNACGCFSLRTGGVAMGLMSLLFNLIYLVFLSCLLAATFIADTVRPDDYNMTKEDLSGIMIFTRGAIIVAIGVVVICFISACLLIYGSMNDRSSHLKPYLIINGVNCTFLILGTLGSLFKAFSSGSAFGSFVGSALFTGLNIYLWLCVYSLYHLIKQERNEYANMPSNFAMPPK